MENLMMIVDRLSIRNSLTQKICTQGRLRTNQSPSAEEDSEVQLKASRCEFTVSFNHLCESSANKCPDFIFIW